MSITTQESKFTLYDADSHIMEPIGWLEEFADKATRENLLPFPFRKVANGEELIRNGMRRVKDPEQTRLLTDNPIGSAKGWPAYGALDSNERSRFLDLVDLKGQLVFSSFSYMQYHGLDSKTVEGGVAAHNRAMSAFCSSDKRLRGVAHVRLDDPETALRQLKLALELDCGAVWIPMGPAGGGSVSPGHVMFDPFWRSLEESKVPMVVHIGIEPYRLPAGYADNGKPPADRLFGGESIDFKSLVCIGHPPQMFLSAIIYDGVLQRFPALKIGVIECGAEWVPSFMNWLDYGAKMFKKKDHNVANLDQKPSDYIRQQVKFTPFHFEDVGELIRQSGPELYMFSTDYPHPEGGRDPMANFSSSLADCSTKEKERFFGKNFEALMG